MALPKDIQMGGRPPISPLGPRRKQRYQLSPAQKEELIKKCKALDLSYARFFEKRLFELSGDDVRKFERYDLGVGSQRKGLVMSWSPEMINRAEELAEAAGPDERGRPTPKQAVVDACIG